jgi:hypothetical protein
MKLLLGVLFGFSGQVLSMGMSSKPVDDLSLDELGLLDEDEPKDDSSRM